MRKIVVVDDNEGILNALEAMLDTAGYTVETSHDGRIFEQLNREDLPDLILLDVLLSGRDGRDICAKLKKDDITKNIPIIMISADPTVKKGINDCGANAFLSKPFDMNELLELIERQLSKADSR